MIPFRVSIVASIAALIFLLVIFELIRSRRLQERYALLWLITGGVILLLSVWRDALRLVAEQIGIAYPPSALFVVGFLFILAVLLHYSTVISELSERNVAARAGHRAASRSACASRSAGRKRRARRVPRLAAMTSETRTEVEAEIAAIVSRLREEVAQRRVAGEGRSSRRSQRGRRPSEPGR